MKKKFTYFARDVTPRSKTMVKRSSNLDHMDSGNQVGLERDEFLDSEVPQVNFWPEGLIPLRKD